MIGITLIRRNSGTPYQTPVQLAHLYPNEVTKGPMPSAHWLTGHKIFSIQWTTHEFGKNCGKLYVPKNCRHIVVTDFTLIVTFNEWKYLSIFIIGCTIASLHNGSMFSTCYMPWNSCLVAAVSFGCRIEIKPLFVIKALRDTYSSFHLTLRNV